MGELIKFGVTNPDAYLLRLGETDRDRVIGITCALLTTKRTYEEVLALVSYDEKLYIINRLNQYKRGNN